MCVCVCVYLSVCLSACLSVRMCISVCACRVSVFVCSAKNIHMLDVCTLISVLGIHRYHVNA